MLSAGPSSHPRGSTGFIARRVDRRLTTIGRLDAIETLPEPI
jgi:hypothetical protein